MKILLHVTSGKIWPESGLSTVNITLDIQTVIIPVSIFHD